MHYQCRVFGHHIFGSQSSLEVIMYVAIPWLTYHSIDTPLIHQSDRCDWQTKRLLKLHRSNRISCLLCMEISSWPQAQTALQFCMNSFWREFRWWQLSNAVMVFIKFLPSWSCLMRQWNGCTSWYAQILPVPWACHCHTVIEILVEDLNCYEAECFQTHYCAVTPQGGNM